MEKEGIQYPRRIDSKVGSIDTERMMSLCADFEEKYEYGAKFDYILIYNSIPHFGDLDKVFLNAACNLKDGGIFMIAHSRTRQGLKDHHQRIGFKSTRVPIPDDMIFLNLAEKYNMGSTELQHEEFFYFSCQTNKKQPAL